MLFNSPAFFLFFPLVTGLYFALHHRYRWLLLLAASCFFYSFFVPIYLLILVFTIVVDYVAAILIERAQGSRRRLYLGLSIVANTGVLAVFKYFNFFSENITAAAHSFGMSGHAPTLSLLLPIGLSFHTFQAMSYTIEVYRGHQKAERHFGIYALYVMFYPQLVAGPIERPQNLLPQLRKPHAFSAEDATMGLRLMLLGLLKKVVVADRAAVFVDSVYDDPIHRTAPALAIATVCFAIQIYADFSGYSDIAIGAARVMGIRLMTNFDKPYLSKSVAEFWKRWHISLSTWFRDYLYLPLGGNRASWARWQFNLMVTFLVSGLWHGAKWTFVAWGVLNGFYLLFANATKSVRGRAHAAVGLHRVPRLSAALQILITFGLTCIAWVFFRARSMSDALYILRAMATGARDYARPAAVLASVRATGFQRKELVVLAIVVSGMLVFDWGSARAGGMAFFARQPRLVRWTTYYAGVFAVVQLGVFGEQQFIYFQF